MENGKGRGRRGRRRKTESGSWLSPSVRVCVCSWMSPWTRECLQSKLRKPGERGRILRTDLFAWTSRFSVVPAWEWRFANFFSLEYSLRFAVNFLPSTLLIEQPPLGDKAVSNFYLFQFIQRESFCSRQNNGLWFDVIEFSVLFFIVNRTVVAATNTLRNLKLDQSKVSNSISCALSFFYLNFKKKIR